jgi:enoyl-CoA hydratase/carnithine racemase
MGFRFLRNAVEKRVATILMNRPEKRNALSPAMLEELESAFKRYGADETVHAIVLTGGEKVFSAGFDLDYIRSIEKEGSRRFCSLFHQTYRAIMFCPVPVIAAVGGAAIAGGFDLTLMCDIRYASAGARFGQREVPLALTPLLDPLWRIIGLGNAREVALTGRIYGADEALRMGYLSRVFPEGQLLKFAMRAAFEMACHNRRTLVETKALSHIVIHSDLDRSMRAQEKVFRTFIGTEENRRKVDALRATLKKGKTRHGNDTAGKRNRP